MKPVIFFPVSEKDMPSSRYRVYMVEEELRKRGYETFIVPPDYSDGQKRAFLTKLSKQSILYVQKVGNSFHIPENFLPYKGRHTIVFDFDDYISMPKVNDMCAVADYIVCGSHFLYEYTKRFAKKSCLIECCQEDSFSCENELTQTDKTLRIVWSQCFAEVYAEDILSISGILSKLHDKYNFDLDLYGFRNTDGGAVKKYVQEKLPFASLHDSLPVDEYNKEILPIIAQADIAIVPFLNDESRKAKAGLGLRNYMAMGVPSVASAVGEHNYIIENGKNGFLAHNEAEWEKYLSMLCEDNASMRNEIIRNAKKDVSAKYSLSSRVDLLEKFLKNMDFLGGKIHSNGDKKICAVVVGRCSGDQEFLFTTDVKGYTAFHWIELFLLNTYLFNRVIFALPDDADHRKMADRLKRFGLHIELGNPDDTTDRFLSIATSDYDYTFRFSLEKPVIDNTTLNQMLALLTQVDAVNSTDESWGVNVQGYSKKLIDCLKSNKKIERQPLLQAAMKLTEFETCRVPFLAKPQYESVKVSFEHKNDLRNLSEFILCSNEIVFEEYQQFLIDKTNRFNAPIYERIKNKKSLLPEKPVTCEVSIYDKASELNTNADFFVILYQNANIVFYEEKPDALHIGIPDHEKDNISFLDLIIEKVSRWCEKNRCNLILSNDNLTVLFAVRLANILNLPVYCYLNEEIDPKDFNIKHYLKMADKIFIADGILTA